MKLIEHLKYENNVRAVCNKLEEDKTLLIICDKQIKRFSRNIRRKTNSIKECRIRAEYNTRARKLPCLAKEITPHGICKLSMNYLKQAVIEQIDAEIFNSSRFKEQQIRQRKIKCALYQQKKVTDKNERRKINNFKAEKKINWEILKGKRLRKKLIIKQSNKTRIEQENYKRIRESCRSRVCDKE
ncbi:unnamed protein product [Moneuplotes crassus]|uniref:Uncharacterized protein n=1 Tax=Euplotes crassus TaxID=5936 RepID=A0AAD1X4B1_EUPCR|nr:unnamed protein product [Moneuplotes crassus]